VRVGCSSFHALNERNILGKICMIGRQRSVPRKFHMRYWIQPGVRFIAVRSRVVSAFCIMYAITEDTPARLQGVKPGLTARINGLQAIGLTRNPFIHQQILRARLILTVGLQPSFRSTMLLLLNQTDLPTFFQLEKVPKSSPWSLPLNSRE
jgi:hypothetical protein